MPAEDLKNRIDSCIKSFIDGNLTERSLALFDNLGYITERQAPLEQKSFKSFSDSYIDDQKFNEEKAFVKDWSYVDLLFQLSKNEILQQTDIFDTNKVDQTAIETYLFFALELKGTHYTRTELAGITREVNRLFPMPAMILFKYDRKLTLSVINRRLHKRDENKDVLEKVTLIKDISIDKPLRAHIEILFDLSMLELLRVHKFTNFVQLHQAWQKTLDIKELNKRFYSELFNWYLWAVRSVKFPNNINDEKDNTVYNSESIIRLITRLIFVWFIKEKNLVPDHLFHKKTLEKILKNFNPDSETTSVYYRAILQNLFFATLNTPMDKDITDENKDEKRQFINVLPKTGNDHYLDQTKYRYKEYFADPDKALELFSNIPFLNGGLFECLDFKEGTKEIRYDGFSSTAGKQAFVPDMLFFANEQPIDLNSEYGSKGKKYKVEGLLNILNSYKFTITENTPIEEEIALDPELLGKVFENLLASYNPETQTTARKKTGSFYTPREIVNYMVDESLIAQLNKNLDNNIESENRLRELFTNSENGVLFNDNETNALIKAISEIKIIDPACGSGAFPMGVLHRLVDLLNKLDSNNKKWNERQKQRAIEETAEVFDSGDKEEREIRLREINKAFDLSMNHPDYARKLFLIENCIYGVDIQQIAIQISKLRFFIALMVDQKVDNSKPNRNILSMPNLETKFVAANSLIGLEKPKQLTMLDSEVEKLENDLASIRHKIFYTRKYAEKKALKKKEKEKREALKAALINSSFSKDTAAQISEWNPFDPMHSAAFFDHDTMFDIKDGFDVVIGNPPYVLLQEKIKKEEDIAYFKLNYISASYKVDLYHLFFEKGVSLLKKYSSLCFITPSNFLSNNYNKSLRNFLVKKTTPKAIINITESVFDASVDTSISLLEKNDDISDSLHYYRGKYDESGLSVSFLISKRRLDVINDVNSLLIPAENNATDVLLKKIEGSEYRLGDIAKINFGMQLRDREKFPNDVVLSKEELLTPFHRKCLTGKDINPFTVEYHNLYCYFNREAKRGGCWDEKAHNMKNKVLIRQIGETPIAGLDEYGYPILNSAFMVYSETYSNLFLLGIINSSLIKAYWRNKFADKRKTFPKIKGGYLELIPIKKPTNDFFEKQIIKFVSEIIKQKKSNTETLELEREIDELVFKLYDLTYDEVKIIAPDFWLSEEDYNKLDSVLKNEK